MLLKIVVISQEAIYLKVQIMDALQIFSHEFYFPKHGQRFFSLNSRSSADLKEGFSIDHKNVQGIPVDVYWDSSELCSVIRFSRLEV